MLQTVQLWFKERPCNLSFCKSLYKRHLANALQQQLWEDLLTHEKAKVFARKTRLRSNNAYLWTVCKWAILIHHDSIGATDGQMPCFWCKNKKARISLRTIIFCFSRILLVSDAARGILPCLWEAKDNMQSFARKDNYKRQGSDGEDTQHCAFNRQQTYTEGLSRYLSPIVSPLNQLYFFHPAINKWPSSLDIIWLHVVLFILTNYVWKLRASFACYPFFIWNQGGSEFSDCSHNIR